MPSCVHGRPLLLCLKGPRTLWRTCVSALAWMAESHAEAANSVYDINTGCKKPNVTLIFARWKLQDFFCTGGLGDFTLLQFAAILRHWRGQWDNQDLSCSLWPQTETVLTKGWPCVSSVCQLWSFFLQHSVNRVKSVKCSNCFGCVNHDLSSNHMKVKRKLL